MSKLSIFQVHIIFKESAKLVTLIQVVTMMYIFLHYPSKIGDSQPVKDGIFLVFIIKQGTYLSIETRQR